MADKVQRRKISKRQLALGLCILALFMATAWFLTSGGFHDWVRDRIVATIEADTGGRTTIGHIEWNVSNLELVLHDVIIHGRESAAEAPFARIDRVYMRARILSVVSRQMRLSYVEADRPVLHLITYPDGTTNQPAPKQARAGSPIDTLFDLQLDRGEVHDGTLLINNDAIPFEGSADGLRAMLAYTPKAGSFEGSVEVTKIDARYHNMRPFAASGHADFTLFRTEAVIRSLTFTSGQSLVNVQGKITNFADPHIALSYSGKIDLSQAAAITRTPGFRAGSAQLQGTATYYAGQYQSTGTTNLRDAAYHAGSAELAGLNAHANFFANNTGLRFTNVRGSVLGGSFEGSGSLEVAVTVRGRLHENRLEERGNIALTFQGFDVERLRGALLRRQRRFELDIRGTASGSIAARWTGTADNAVAEFAINVAPPARAAPGEVPVVAAARGTYDGASSSVGLQQLQLTMPFSRLQASGEIAVRNTALHVSATTSQFRELQSALADLGIDFTIPAEIRGPFTFTGDVSGTLADPRISGHVVASDFDYLAEFTAQGLISGTAQPQASAPTRIHWDRIVADLQYSAEAVGLRNATLEAGAARILLNGSVALNNGHVMPTSRLDIQATVQNEDAQHLAAILGMQQYELHGVVSGSARLSGAAGNPSGSGTIRVTNVPIGQLQGTVSSAFTLREHEAQFTSVDIGRGHAHLTGTAAFNLLSNGFAFNLHGGVIDLATLPELQTSRLTLAGKLTFAAQGSGTAAAPEINGSLHVADLLINGESVGDVNAQAVTRNGKMQISASTTAPTAQLQIKGSVTLRDEFPAAFTVSFPHLDFDPLLRAFLKGRLTGHSLAAGTAQVNGSLKNLHALTVDASVEQFSVSIEKVNLSNVAPVRLRVANETLTLDQFHVAGSNTDLTASGSLPLAAGRSMDLRADGAIDLAIIQTIDPNFTAAGKIALNVRAQGTTARPLLTGRLDVQNASIAYIDLPNGLSAASGTLVFDQNRLVVQTLTAQSGGGTLTLGGYVAYSNGLAFNISATAQDMRLRYPPGVSAIANANLHWSGTPRASTLSGDLMVTRFTMSPQFDFATYLGRASQPLPVAAVTSALNDVRVDVHVQSAPALQVSTSLAKVSGDVDLRIRGTVADPVVLGRVNILRGTIFFNGTNYTLQRGDITFVNPTTIQPVLNLEFSTRIAGYDINLSLDGPLDHLHTTYRSDPPLPSTDIISLLAFRQCPTSAEFTCSPSAVEQAETYNPGGTTNFTETASNQILGEALNATLSNRVQRLFGISRVKISPEIAAAIGNPSARITIEQQVSNNVTITYVTDVAQATQQVIQVEYNVNRNLSIVAVRDQFGVLSFDVRIRRRKR